MTVIDGSRQAHTWNGVDAALFAAAAVKPADRVLDVGCGTGATTRIAARPAARGHAVGVDISAPLLRTAQKLTAAEKVANASYQVADAQVRPFPPCGYDMIASRGSVPSLVCPRSGPGPDRVRSVLNNWENVEVEWHDGIRLGAAGRPSRMPTDAD
ncbi:class I SAM-dependent methyltransferase [Streptomyces sp. NPDC051172]|uniref:class I SAM-dependent methyltransferase n=1 Tax=Streptomyces sp. NPDC051172 TaxID=3155796 RepID=UPI0034464291